MAGIHTSGNASVTALLKPAKLSTKATNGMLKARMTIMKNAVKAYSGKQPKSKIPSVKMPKLPKLVANPTMGKFLTKQMSKAKHSFM